MPGVTPVSPFTSMVALIAPAVTKVGAPVPTAPVVWDVHRRWRRLAHRYVGGEGCLTEYAQTKNSEKTDLVGYRIVPLPVPAQNPRIWQDSTSKSLLSYPSNDQSGAEWPKKTEVCRLSHGHGWGIFLAKSRMSKARSGIPSRSEALNASYVILDKRMARARNQTAATCGCRNRLSSSIWSDQYRVASGAGVLPQSNL